MKYKDYDFSADKNEWLKDNRDISFEEVIAALEDERLLDVIPHDNLAKYPNQSMYVLNINEYVYVVPFVKTDENKVFLKTIFPQRKLTKKYLRDKI